MDSQYRDRITQQAREHIRQTPGPAVKAMGSRLLDAEGRQYLDFHSAAGALNYGFHNMRLRQRLAHSLAERRCLSSIDRLALARQEFRQALQDEVLVPAHLDYLVQFTGRTGAGAIDAAIRLARRLTGRLDVMAFRHDVSGNDDGAVAAMADLCLNRYTAADLPRVLFMPYDGCQGPDVDTVAHFERMLGRVVSDRKLPAAVVVETVMCEGGINALTWRWLKELEKVCRAYGIVLIMDDTLAGCGRAGSYLSFETAGIQPDIVVLSKSLSGFGLPMSVLLRHARLPVSIQEASGGTAYDELALLSAAHAVREYWTGGRLARELRRKECLLRDWLENTACSHPEACLGVRGRGLVQGLVFPAAHGLASRVAQVAGSRGLVLDTCGVHDEVIRIMPALTIEESQLMRGLEIIDSSVCDVLAQHASRTLGARSAGPRR
ncbi:MAG: aminotransferase class III-fold pyridoxal phosphate-dependent enzyme [Candidimonas sp.]